MNTTLEKPGRLGLALWTLSFAVALGASAVTASADDSASAPSPETADLAVALSTPRDAIATYEPLALVLTIRNTGGSEATIPRIFEDGKSRSFAIEVETPTGARYFYESPLLKSRAISSEAMRVTLGPGEAYVHRQVIYASAAGPRGAMFGEPGEYTLRAMLWPQIRIAVVPVEDPASEDSGGEAEPLAEPNPQVVSEPLVVRVYNPTGVLAEASTLWRDTVAQSHYLLYGDFLAERPETGTLADSFAETPFGEYATYYLADASQRPEGYLWLLNERPDFPLRDECVVAVCEKPYAYAPGMSLEERLGLLEGVARRNPRSDLAERALRLLDGEIAGREQSGMSDSSELRALQQVRQQIEGYAR